MSFSLSMSANTFEKIKMNKISKKTFGNLITLSQPGGQIMLTLYWCPQQVLKATGTPIKE